MAAESGRFRGALGGFNRRDVVQYIEKAAREHREETETLRARLDEEQRENNALKEELAGLRSQSGDLADQEAKVRASLEESTQTLTRLRGELQVTQGQLTIAKKQLGDLQAKVAKLEPMARQYEVLKDRVATVELDAHRKAQEIVTQAETQAETVRRDAAAGLSELLEQYEALWRETESCARRAEEISRAFSSHSGDLEALRRLVAGEEQDA